MTTLNSNELKERERKAWASVADSWKRRDALLTRGAAPVTLHMRGTTWLASVGK